MKESKELTVIDRAAIALNASAVEKQIHELLEKSKGITVITNAAGRDECHAAAMQTVKARTSISKDGAAARADATAYSKAVIAEEKRLLGLIEPEEARLRTLRDEWDAKIEAEKAAKAQQEAERQAAIQARIDNIKNSPLKAINMTAAGIKEFLIDALTGEPDEASFAERLDEAKYVLNEALVQLKTMYQGKLAQEQLAAQQEAARLESERIALELAAQRLAEEKAQREAMAAQAAELARQEAEFNRRSRELAEAEAKVKAAQESILAAERAKMEEEVRAKAEEEARARGKAEFEASNANRIRVNDEQEAAFAKTTLCWKCNHVYPLTAATCDKCGATNANVDPDRAKIEETGFSIEEHRKAAQIAAQTKPFKHSGNVYVSAKEERPSRGAIIGCIASHFGVNEDMALDWVLAEFRGDIAFAARKEAA